MGGSDDWWLEYLETIEELGGQYKIQQKIKGSIAWWEREAGRDQRVQDIPD